MHPRRYERGRVPIILRLLGHDLSGQRADRTGHFRLRSSGELLVNGRAQLDTAAVEYTPEITLFLQLIADGALDRSNIYQVFSMPYSFVEIPRFVFDHGRNIDRFLVEPGDLKLEIFYTRLK